MGTTRLLQAVSKIIPVIRAQTAPSAALHTFRFGSSAVKDPGIGGKYMPNFTEPATPFPERPGVVKPQEIFPKKLSPNGHSHTKLFASDFLEEREWLDDHNGAAGSHRLSDQAAFARVSSREYTSPSIEQTVVGKILKEAAVEKAAYDIPSENYARDLIAALETRPQRTHTRANNKDEFSKTTKEGPSPYKITTQDVYKLVASENSNHFWPNDLQRLAAEGRVNHRSVHEAIRRSDAIRVELADYKRISNFCAG